jgi:hypothetical protein
MRFRPSRIAGLGSTGLATGMPTNAKVESYRFAEKVARMGRPGWIPQTGIEENQGGQYPWAPDLQEQSETPLNPGIDVPGYVNPFRTVMYSITGIGTSVPVQALTGNPARTYLIVQNLGPGNLFLGIGIQPVAGGANVMNLVDTQLYEQIGGGFFLPPNPWYSNGVAICSSFVSPEYISLLADTAGTAAMIMEGSWNAASSGIDASALTPYNTGSTSSQ